MVPFLMIFLGDFLMTIYTQNKENVFLFSVFMLKFVVRLFYFCIQNE